MADTSVKTQASAWDYALWTGNEPLISDIDELVFDLSSSTDMLDNLGDKKDADLNTKKAMYLTLLTLSLIQNGLKSLEDI